MHTNTAELQVHMHMHSHKPLLATLLESSTLLLVSLLLGCHC